MRYIGGKKRQSKQIVAAVVRLRPDFRVYVEPFCGAMWSACAVIRRFPDRRFILSDANPYLMCFWKAAIEDGWNPPVVTESMYCWYREHRPNDDPLTGYIGFACSFGGKFFGGWARDTAGKRNFSREPSRASLEKLRVLRNANVTLGCLDYQQCTVPLGSVVYTDPPYVDRTPQARNKFDRGQFTGWAEQTSSRAMVITSEFINDRGWPVLHDWGDTVVRHLNGIEPDGTRELLMRVTHV